MGTFMLLMLMIFTVFAGSISAYPLEPPTRPRIRNYIQSRQAAVPNVPPQCQASCNPINTVISDNNGCPEAICCTTSFESTYFECFECVGDAVNLTDWSVPQQDLDHLVVACDAGGESLSKLTFPGQNANRTLATSIVASTLISSSGSGASSSFQQSTIFPTAGGSSSSISTFQQSTIFPSSGTSSSSTAASTATSSNQAVSVKTLLHGNFRGLISPIFFSLMTFMWAY